MQVEAGAERGEPRVLVVEDDPSSRDLAVRWLKRRGFRAVDAAGDGVEGLAVYRASHPDIVLVDPHLPRLDGVAMVEALAVPGGAGRPWLVLFTAASDATVEHLMRLGLFDDVLRKPCGMADYAECMTRALAGLSARRRAA